MGVTNAAPREPACRQRTVELLDVPGFELGKPERAKHRVDLDPQVVTVVLEGAPRHARFGNRLEPLVAVLLKGLFGGL